MRLWSLHPIYLDSKGLLAVWREALLAQKVLKGETVGYRHHPQLTRFKSQTDPVAAIATYLEALAIEARRRGYHFDANRIDPQRMLGRIPITHGQLLYEWEQLKSKLHGRAPGKYLELLAIPQPRPHPLFFSVSGGIEPWEIVRQAL